MTKEITTSDQIKCIERLMNFQIRYIEVSENETQADIEQARIDLECLKAIHETLSFDYMLENTSNILPKWAEQEEAMTI